MNIKKISLLLPALTLATISAHQQVQANELIVQTQAARIKKIEQRLNEEMKNPDPFRLKFNRKNCVISIDTAIDYLKSHGTPINEESIRQLQTKQYNFLASFSKAIMFEGYNNIAQVNPALAEATLDKLISRTTELDCKDTEEGVWGYYSPISGKNITSRLFPIITSLRRDMVIIDFRNLSLNALHYLEKLNEPDLPLLAEIAYQRSFQDLKQRFQGVIIHELYHMLKLDNRPVSLHNRSQINIVRSFFNSRVLETNNATANTTSIAKYNQMVETYNARQLENAVKNYLIVDSRLSTEEKEKRLNQLKLKLPSFVSNFKNRNDVKVIEVQTLTSLNLTINSALSNYDSALKLKQKSNLVSNKTLAEDRAGDAVYACGNLASNAYGHLAGFEDIDNFISMDAYSIEYQKKWREKFNNLKLKACITCSIASFPGEGQDSEWTYPERIKDVSQEQMKQITSTCQKVVN